MKKIILSALFILIASTSANLFAQQRENIGNNVYGVYSQNFNGNKIQFDVWTGQVDRQEKVPMANRTTADAAEIWTGTWSSAYVNAVETYYAAGETSVDGDVYQRITMTASGGTSWFPVFFINGTLPANGEPGYNAGQDRSTYHDMSQYTGGRIEFWARSTYSMATSLKAGFVRWTVVNDGSGNRVGPLSSYGFVADGTWHKVSIPIGTGSGGLGTDADLTQTKATFFLLADVAGTNLVIDVDGIVWKKAGNPVSFDAKLMDLNTINVSSRGYISWSWGSDSNDIGGTGWKVANQYLELNLDGMPGDNWGIQIYTDCTPDNPNANPKYTGPVDPTTAFGLVSTTNGTQMVPLAWRVSKFVIPYVGIPNAAEPYPNQTLQIAEFPGGLAPDSSYMNAGLYDSGSGDPQPQFYHSWFYMKDKKQFVTSPVDLVNDIYNGADYVRVWDRRGIHTAAGSANYAGMTPGNMVNMRIAPKLYFALNTNKVQSPNIYTNNSIILQLFIE